MSFEFYFYYFELKVKHFNVKFDFVFQFTYFIFPGDMLARATSCGAAARGSAVDQPEPDAKRGIAQARRAARAVAKHLSQE